jgi:hypothetical protein
MKQVKRVQHLHADFPGHGISVKLSLYTYIDENVNVVYSPALDLYGYGNDELEARQSFDLALREYIAYTVKHKTLEADLKQYGWTLNKRQKLVKSPDMSSLLHEREVFQQMVNDRPFKKFDLQIELPVFVS